MAPRKSDETPAKQYTPTTRPSSMTEKRMASLAKGRETRAENARRAREAREAGAPTRLSQLLDGVLKVADLDDEELARGYPKDRGGGFAGRPPKIPARLGQEMKRELLQRGQKMLDAAYYDAIKTLHGIAKSAGAKDADRARAANIIIERVAGKMPETVQLKSADPWQDILDEIMDDEVLEPVERDDA